MDDTRDQARGRFAQLQRTMQPHITQLQERVQTVPDRLANLSDNRLSLPAFPAKAEDAGQTRSRSNSDDYSAPPPPPPPAPLIRAPALHDPAYNHDLAALAAKILYRAGTDPVSGGPLLILCAAAFPDANEVDYTVLLPYVLSNLPADEELGGLEDGAQNGGYSVIFFAGGGADGKPAPGRPSWKWTLQAYTLVGVFRELAGTVNDERQRVLADGSGQLGRAVRKKIRKLWVVHEKGWIRE
jgi:Rho GTPase-activating protein 1